MKRPLLSSPLLSSPLLSSPLLLAALFSIGTANATILTFDGNICNGGGSCGPEYSLPIDQSYGDTPGQLDVQYTRDITSSLSDQRLKFYPVEFNDLINIAYGGGGTTPGIAEIFLKPSSGYSVTLNGFDLGAWYFATLNSQFTIVDGSSNTILLTRSISVGNSNVSHYSYSDSSYSSSGGIKIQWGPDASSVGIDNVNFTVSPISENTVPEPATLALIGVGLVGLGFSRRRRA